MKVYGLTSTEPIVKKYELENGQTKKTPYPFVSEFTSTEYEINNIQELRDIILNTAKVEGCLIKGVLNESLCERSRAGATTSDTETEWICLDLDGVQGTQSVDHFLEEIGLGDTDYILQWSSSMGIENNSGFRCHIFMLLDKPASPLMLKQWLQHLNLTSPTLQNSLQLTKTYSSLRWPLDITTCQNDKLIYVAPPHLGEGMVDPLAPLPRISCTIKGKRKAFLPEIIPSQTALREATDEKVNDLRLAAGYKKKKPAKYEFAGEVEYLEKPDRATITGKKVERGFVYFNLNGGNSWGYYHPEDNPSFIYNFKGEPVYKTSELLPSYWASVAQRVKDYKPDTTGTIYLVFRDLHTASYWNGTYNANTNELKIYKANSKDQLHDFLKQHGQPIPDCISDWVMTFDPHGGPVIDTQRREVNDYRASEYLTKNPRQQSTVPPTIHTLVSHFLGGDAVTIEHFYNWLAVIAQKLDRTGTCWLLQGIQGTGKGIFFHRVLKPIFGETNVVAKRAEEIESNFTSYFRNKFFVFIDEMEVSNSDYFSKVNAKLKTFIVEPTISIRPMYNEAVEVRNFSNIIFSSNKVQGVQVDVDDRRYNVGAFQRQVVWNKEGTGIITSHDIDVMIPSELQDFADYLRTRSVDVDKARFPLDNAPRRKLQRIGQTAINEISMELRNGNLAYFAQWVVDPETAGGMKKYAAKRYRDLIVELAQSQRTYLTREDLQDILEWLLDNVPKSPVKFSAFIKHHDIEFSPQWIGGKTIRVIQVNWKIDQTWTSEFLSQHVSDQF